MFDYNLLGKGIAYGDVRNVTCALSHEAAENVLLLGNTFFPWDGLLPQDTLFP